MRNLFTFIMSFAALSAAACGEAPADPLQSSGSQSGGGGSGGDACGACSAHERCVDGACVPLKYLRVRVNKALEQKPPDEVSLSESLATACYYEYISGPTSRTPPPSSATCVVKEMTAAPAPVLESIVADAGPVLISGPKLGQLVLDPPEEVDDTCEFHGSPINPFEEGEEVTISSPGGADFPAFSSTFEAPSAPILYAGALVRGEPFPVEWSGSGAEHFWFVVVPLGPGAQIECQVPDTGSYTVPAEMTAALDPSATQALLFAGRTVFRTVDDDSTATTLTTSVGVSTSLEIDYIPEKK